MGLRRRRQKGGGGKGTRMDEGRAFQPRPASKVGYEHADIARGYPVNTQPSNDVDDRISELLRLPSSVPRQRCPRPRARAYHNARASLRSAEEATIVPLAAQFMSEDAPAPRQSYHLAAGAAVAAASITAR